jgi:putative tryptophan/tyrosine transport system substrate-binding protein
MKRRDFIIVVGVAAALQPFAPRAQSPTKPPIIGYLFPEFASSRNQWTAAFVRRLQELGWIEGSTLNIEYRWAEGKVERLDECRTTYSFSLTR